VLQVRHGELRKLYAADLTRPSSGDNFILEVGRRTAMTLKRFFVFTAFGMLSVSTALAGDAAYKATDIIKFFDKSRGICVGTKEECEPAQKSGGDALGFNLQVTFNVDSADLTDDAKANLGEFSKALKDGRLASAKFAVEGYTDASGSENYNMSLSEKRAKSVVDFLAAQGVDTAMLSAKGFGESSPKSVDPLAPENRRVETRLIRQ
jgi:OmpA-OmpF porin, OOP family